jgi:N-hydroxyarylamine O-acetyltransferase
VLPTDLVADYLTRVGCEPLAGTPPSVAGLRRLHQAHVERVAYETVDLGLGRPAGIDPRDSAGRIASGRGGYCFTLNGGFSWLLGQLGYDVVRHVAGVYSSAAESSGADANHLGLTVRGLPAAECPDGVWLVDVALGDALHDPIPLRWGEHPQGPFTYRLLASPVEDGGWRLEHAAGGSFAGVDFAPDAAGMDAFADRHSYLSTDPDSPFVRTLTAQLRDAAGVDILRGRVLTRWDGAGAVAREADLDEWWTLLTGHFGLSLDEADRAPLWAKVAASHEKWLAAGRH